MASRSWFGINQNNLRKNVGVSEGLISRARTAMAEGGKDSFSKDSKKKASFCRNTEKIRFEGGRKKHKQVAQRHETSIRF
jgi:hypothetical protein